MSLYVMHRQNSMFFIKLLYFLHYIYYVIALKAHRNGVLFMKDCALLLRFCYDASSSTRKKLAQE